MSIKHLLIALAVALPASASAESFNPPQPQPQQGKLQVAKVKSFDFGNSYVHGDEREELQRVANLWRQRRQWWTITVEGHGFVANNEEASIELGEKRARRVRDLLVKYGVDPRFVIAVGNSREEPGRYVEVTVDTCERCRR
jgi:outer membrane protein OmpA-like peptidoglycan-associated protein